MKADERRYTPRFKSHIPMRIRLVASAGLLSQLVELFDISERGAYISTDLPLQVGSPIHMFLRTPEEIAGKLQPEWRCTCRVVRVLPGQLPSHMARVGVEIQYCEVLGA
jgi:hypothetical protein